MMDRIIAEVEADPHYRKATDAAASRARGHDLGRDLRRAAAGGRDPAGGGDRDLHHLGLDQPARGARAPAAPILGLTPDLATARRLRLVWGTYRSGPPRRRSCRRSSSMPAPRRQPKATPGPGDIIAIAAGMPFGVAGTTTNLLRIARLPGGPT